MGVSLHLKIGPAPIHPAFSKRPALQETAPSSIQSKVSRFLTADTSNDYISAVNSVIGVCKDAEEGFRGAANAVKDASLKSVFEEYSSQRAEFGNELRAAVKNAGGEPADSSGILGTLHHGWIALKGALTGHSEHQILEETERGEDFSLSRYRDALAHEVPTDLRSVLERQYQQVQSAHTRIKALRDSLATHGSAVA